jgi:hypothetical protein
MVEVTHRRVRPRAFCHDEQWCLPSIVVEWLYDDERMTSGNQSKLCGRWLRMLARGCYSLMFVRFGGLREDPSISVISHYKPLTDDVKVRVIVTLLCSILELVLDVVQHSTTTTSSL